MENYLFIYSNNLPNLFFQTCNIWKESHLLDISPIDVNVLLNINASSLISHYFSGCINLVVDIGLNFDLLLLMEYRIIKNPV